MYFRKIGIKSGIHFGKIGIRSGYVFETSMARPRPKSGQESPPPPGFCYVSIFMKYNEKCTNRWCVIYKSFIFHSLRLISFLRAKVSVLTLKEQTGFLHMQRTIRRTFVSFEITS